VSDTVHQEQHVPESTSLFNLEQSSNQPIRFEGQVIVIDSLCQVYALTSLLFAHHFPLI